MLNTEGGVGNEKQVPNHKNTQYDAGSLDEGGFWLRDVNLHDTEHFDEMELENDNWTDDSEEYDSNIHAVSDDESKGLRADEATPIEILLPSSLLESTTAKLPASMIPPPPSPPPIPYPKLQLSSNWLDKRCCAPP